jgi:hypothetical protein
VSDLICECVGVVEAGVQTMDLTSTAPAPAHHSGTIQTPRNGQRFHSGHMNYIASDFV